MYLDPEAYDVQYDVSSKKTLHDFVLEQAELTPLACAIAGDGAQALTYQELVARSNQWMAALVQLGTKPGERIAVALHRTPDLICALLGILRAGCTYVPLDPAYPAAYREFVLEDSAARVVLCDDASDVPQAQHQVKICTAEDLPSVSEDQPNAQIDDGSIAYLIYTSGSTGKSKGVLVGHNNVVNLIQWALDRYTHEETKCVLFSTSICFDISVFEMFLPLSCGGTVYVVSDALSLVDDTPSLPISLINTVPSVMRELLRMNAIPTTARTINVAGEPVNADLVRDLHAQPGVSRVCNLYGPTETTVYSTFCELTSKDSSPTIGRPIRETSIRLEGENGDEVNAGDVGEIVILGAGVAAGYLGRPDDMRARFFTKEIGGRTVRGYRTGDLGRWRADGNLECLGRSDDQIKIRGFRVEPAQVEDLLRQCPGVIDAAVVAVAVAGEPLRLVAHLSTDSVSEKIIEGARSTLMQRLPRYMVPTEWKTCPLIPRLPNGKVDRVRLRTMDDVDRQLSPLAWPSYQQLEALPEGILNVLLHPIKSPLEHVISAALAVAVARVAQLDVVHVMLIGASAEGLKFVFDGEATFASWASSAALYEANDAEVRLVLGEGAVAKWTYSSDVQRKIEHVNVADSLSAVLQRIVSEPMSLLRDLPLLGADEYIRLVQQSNATDEEIPGHETLVGLVEEQVMRTPNALAIAFEDECTSYAELDARATDVARHLRSLGVGPDCIVGVFAERSIDMVVALLATLKAGGAYLPLDPTLPADRIRFMADDAKVAIILAQRHLQNRLPVLSQPVCWLEDEHGNNNDINLPPVATSHLAYVLYTSGSTGQPKAVCITHAGIVNRILWMQRAYPISGDDRILQKTPFSFDVSLWEFFWPLTQGAMLIMAKPGGHQDAQYLYSLVEQKGITVMHFVPPMLEPFLNEVVEGQCGSLRHVFCSGQELPVALARAFHQCLSDTSLHNLYGPTEASVDVSSWTCLPGDTSLSIPIGRPIANTQLYVLDSCLQPVPAGVVGELFIAGAGLARGYLGKPELTEQVFINNPFGSPGSRMYRTGDRVRYRVDGALEYLGRLDTQIKLRGVRIELGEIEHLIAQQPGVYATAVLLHEPTPHSQQLVAYVATKNQKIDRGALREALAATLPVYMLPSVWVVMESLPLNANGKVDRRNLPAPVQEIGEPLTREEEPVSSLEKVIAGIWSDVIGIAAVGRNDHFFEIGGDSRAAHVVAHRLAKTLCVAVPVSTLFESPKLTEFSQRVALNKKIDALPFGGLVHVKALPMTSAQRQMLSFSMLMAPAPVANVAFCLKFVSRVSLSEIEAALKQVQKNNPLLSARASEDGEWVFSDLELPLLIESIAADDKVLYAKVVAAARTPIDPRDGYGWQGQLFLRPDLAPWLLLTLHHLLVDEVSVDIIMRQFQKALEGVSGEPQTAQPEFMPHDEITDEKDIAWWKCKVERVPPISIPLDFTASTASHGQLDCERRRHLFGATTWAKIGEVASIRGLTRYEFLVASLSRLLSIWSGQSHVVLGTMMSTRSPFLDPQIGFEAALVPLIIEMSQTAPWADVLGVVRDAVRSSHLHAHASAIQLQGLARALYAGKDLLPVRFGMIDAPARRLEKSDFIAEEVNLGVSDALLDFQVRVHKTGAELYVDGRTASFRGETLDWLLSGWVASIEASVKGTPFSLSPSACAPAVHSVDTRSVVDCFEEHVQRHPDACAISADGMSISRKALHELSRNIGAHLNRVAAPGAPVIIWCGSVISSVAAMLACLQNRCVFVPVSQKEPVSRLGDIVSSVGAQVAIVDTASLWPSAEVPISSIINVADPKDSGPISIVARGPVPGASAPAYVLFTSGTTGRPKGVAQDADALNYHIMTYVRSVGMTQSDHISLIADVCYDAALMDIFGALASGARLVAWNLSRSGIAGLLGWFSQETITIFHGTPSVFREVFTSAGPLSLPLIRCIVLGGEAALSEDLALFNRRCPPEAILINGFGPTESTMALQAHFRHGEACDLPSLPIGTAVTGTDIALISDEIGESTMTGEIEIRSPYVKLGYVHHPDDLAALILLDTATRPRAHRTGDIGRFLPDGRLVHIGRRDHQIKVAGVRIEPAEVEAALHRLDGVAQACLRFWQREVGNAALVAYVVQVADAGTRTPEQWRSVLATRLPSAMLPIVMTVPLLPRLSNGKIDWNQLPLPGLTGAYQGRSLTEHEQAIAATWSKVLRLEHPIGPADTFMRLGGNSLMAMSVCAAVGRLIGRRILPSSLLLDPTLECFAAESSPSQTSLSNTVTESLALLPQQLRFWFNVQLRGADDGNHILWAARLHGRVNLEAAVAAMRCVFDRHEMLRAKMVDSDPPSITIANFVAAPLAFESVARLPEVLTPQHLPASLREPFDLCDGPLLRAAILSGPEDDRLVMVCHHIIADARSCEVILHDFDRAYASIVLDGAQPQLDAPPSFAQAVTRLQTASDQVREDASSYWRKALDGSVTVLNLPGLSVLEPSRTVTSIRKSLKLNEPLRKSLFEFCSLKGFSPTAVFLAAYSLVLCRHVGENDVTIGMPTSLREAGEDDELVAPLLNVLPVRCRLPAEGDFLALCRHATLAIAGALDHADLPFEDILALVNPVRASGRHPLFQAVLSVHYLRVETGRLRTLAPVDTNSSTLSCDLALTVELRAEEVVLSLDGIGGRLHPRWLGRVCEQICTVMTNGIASEHAALESMVIVPKKERDEIVYALASGGNMPRQQDSIVEQFLQNARRRPGAWALRGRHMQTYAELAMAAQHLAERLVEHGVSKGSIVPFIANDDINPAAVALGILMADAAFLPIDPAWPSSVREAALDVGASILIEQDGASVALRPRGQEVGRKKSETLTGEAAVYVIFTSGSTARPKAVAIAQRGLLNRFAWMTSFFGDEMPNTLQTTPLAFDSAVWQVLWPLTRGGTCVLPERHELFDVEALATLVAREQVTVADFVPSVLQSLLPEFESANSAVGRLQGLRWVILGAERLRAETARRLSALLPAARIVNLYGPTEATIGCIYHEISGDTGAIVPIGRPLPNVQAYVTGKDGWLLPRGAVGELVVSGDCVGIGYLGQTTANGFCTVPFAEGTDARAYRTGDLVRWNEQGELEYYGRIDSQLKIRGIRIEPSGVEKVIYSYPGVQEVELLVVPGEESNPQDELVAFVKPKSGYVLQTSELDLWLRERLPAGWVPGMTEVIDAIPRHISGKLDTQDLLSRVKVNRTVEVTDSSDLGGCVRQIWRELLKHTNHIPATATFFDVGGHSLLMLGLRRRLVERLGVTVSIADLFRHSTVPSQVALLVSRGAQINKQVNYSN